MTTPAARINCSYPNAAAIKAIGPNDRQNGDPVFDAETGIAYHFDADSSASAADGVLVPDAGDGRWRVDEVASGDAGGFTAATTHEAQLQEIYQDLKTSKLIVPVRLFGGILAAGTPMAAFADNASSNPGVTLANSKALGLRWNNNATQTAVWAEPIEIPYEADVSADATLRILCSKVGATVGDATTFTITAFAGTVGQLHDADADFGGTSSAITGDAATKTIQQSTLTLAAANLAALAAPAFLSLSIKPSDGTLGTDDVIVHAVFIEFKRKLRTS